MNLSSNLIGNSNDETNSVVAERFIRTLKNKIYKYITSVLKNVYIDKLDDIVNKYNNTYHSTTKTKPADIKSIIYIDSSKENNDKNPKFKIGDIVRISKYKSFCVKDYIPNWSEEVYVIKKVKNIVSWTYVINDLFLPKQIAKKKCKMFRIEKVIEKGDKFCVKCKGYNKLFISWIDKKDIVWMGEYFPKPKSLWANVKVELDLSNYATKADLKNASGVDTSDFANKTNLVNLKSEIVKLDIDKLKNITIGLSSLKSQVDKLDLRKLESTPVDLSKLSDIVKMKLLKKLNKNN